MKKNWTRGQGLRGSARSRWLVRGPCALAGLGLLLCIVWTAPSLAADPDAKQQMQSLDEQVQEIKSDVLGIAAELTRLEEKLLFPSSTQLSVFVSIAEGETLELDSVQIDIDGAPAARHIYSFKELEALRKGGVQRIYTGNLETGDHQLNVSVIGKMSGGGELAGAESFAFRKEVGPKLVGIELGGDAFGAARIEMEGW